MYIHLCAQVDGAQRLVLNVLSQSSYFVCCHGTLRLLLQLVNSASSPLGNSASQALGSQCLCQNWGSKVWSLY